MKKFVKKNTIISIFGFIAILISASYAITFEMIDYVVIENWYSLFNNISVSYIAALIFYILQVYKPECESNRKAQMALKPLFLDLIRFIEITIVGCRKYVLIAEDGKIRIDWCDKEQKIIYFVPLTNTTDEHNHCLAVSKSESELKELESIYKSKIKGLKESIHFRECDANILDILSKLEATDFFKSTINAVLMFEGTFIGFPDFQKQVDKLEELKDEFKKCCGITCRYDIRDVTDSEKAVYNAIFHEKALQAKSVNEFNGIVDKEFIKL